MKSRRAQAAPREEAAPVEPLFDTVAICGVGLLGASLGLALGRGRLARCRIGVGRSAERLEAARSQGAIDEASTELIESVQRAQLVVLCGPVSVILQQLPYVLRNASPGALVTDVGSTKRSIVEAAAAAQAREGVDFVGSHPIAGSEKSGAAHARADLYRGAPCVLTPDLATSDEAVARARALWEALGMDVVEMLPARHDRLLAVLSHVPHLMASALVEQALREERVPLELQRRVAGSGFRDTTRVAMGSVDMWADIVRENAPALDQAIGSVRDILLEVQEAIRDGDDEALRDFLHRAAEGRLGFERGGGGAP